VKLDPGLDALRQEILRVTTQLREMIGELRPAGLEDFGIGSVLESFVHKLQRQAGIAGPQIEADIEQNDCELSEPVRICLFRVSQEALRNTLKHAGARHIQLHLYHTEGEVVLEIHDDGCGFTVPERLSELTQSNHYGLIGIAERVAWVNGRLEIRSRPGQGTNILVWIPI
jgi:signal transduction histidine kinase